MSDHSFARAWRTVAELRPDRLAIVCGERRLTFAELDDRAARLACVLRDAGLGSGDKVSIMCVNAPEYLETFFAAQKLGAVPVNVNYRYVGAELAYLLDNSDTAALVFHDDFAATVADALATLPADRRPRVLLQVAHAHNGIGLDSARDYERALAEAPTELPTTREPSGDDLVGGAPGQRRAVEREGARAHRQHAGDHPQQRRLAGAVGADDGHRLAALHAKPDVPQRGEVAVAGGDAGELQQAHASTIFSPR